MQAMAAIIIFDCDRFCKHIDIFSKTNKSSTMLRASLIASGLLIVVAYCSTVDASCAEAESHLKNHDQTILTLDEFANGFISEQDRREGGEAFERAASEVLKIKNLKEYDGQAVYDALFRTVPRDDYYFYRIFRFVPDEYKQRDFSKSMVRNFYNKWLVEPCREYVDVLKAGEDQTCDLRAQLRKHVCKLLIKDDDKFLIGKEVFFGFYHLADRSKIIGRG